MSEYPVLVGKCYARNIAKQHSTAFVHAAEKACVCMLGESFAPVVTARRFAAHDQPHPLTQL